ncbi:MAG: glutamine-hydrolyzing GMP synthase [Planctomycetota bacterium]|nr:glutamine-hydrolyzing GMP synthase [Planctomycetota bacterium]
MTGSTAVKIEHQRFFVVDFGSQYAQLIARRVRELGCYAEIVLPNDLAARVNEATGVIFSGSPWSAYDEAAPRVDPAVYAQGVPILGICYGMQLTTHLLGGAVQKADAREYGPARIQVLGTDTKLFDGLDSELDVWMSHGDRVEALPEGFVAIAKTDSAPFAAARHRDRPIYGVQFHPEVTHTPRGTAILRNFLYGVCGARGDWTMRSYIEEACEKIAAQVGADEQVICGLSGGVDSTVAAILIHKAIGDRLTCIFVDNGLLRKNEAQQVLDTFRNRYNIPLIFADEGDRFLDALEGVADPEVKRKRIGHVFVDVFKHHARDVPNAAWLAQGTLYPDVIESQSAFGGASVTIKTHHNVGGLPEELGFKLLEPFRELFKDEVRQIGRELGVPDAFVERQPFPGPGLGVRITGVVTREAVGVLQEADAIIREEIERDGHHKGLWQYFGVLAPVKTVGVMGDERTYENVVAVRAVESTDAMTADWADLPRAVLGRISNRIINEVRGVNRVVYDISTKPPATIEWE